jgi:2-methylcitrate dehydratase PrpD
LYATHLGADLKKWDLGAAVRGLGIEWETAQVAVKPFPACQLNISCIDAAIALRRQYSIKPADIESVEALIPPHAVKIVCEPLDEKRRPPSRYAAQFSIPFVVACGLIHGKLGLAELEHYNDPEILTLADKVGYRVDPRTGYPKHFSGEVIVTLKNGRQISHREQVNRGAADNPISDADIIAKFMDNAQLATTVADAAGVRKMILNIDTLDNARKLADALSRNVKA